MHIKMRKKERKTERVWLRRMPRNQQVEYVSVLSEKLTNCLHCKSCVREFHLESHNIDFMYLCVFVPLLEAEIMW